MLPGPPVEVPRNRNTSEVIVFYADSGMLRDTILKASSEPGIDVARNIYNSCSDKIVPEGLLVSISKCVVVGNISLPRGESIVAMPK